MSALDGLYLRSYLGPFAALLARADVTDIYVNRPLEIWAETTSGAVERYEDDSLDAGMLMRLIRQVAAHSSQAVSREHPVLSATLPDGSRLQAVLPPATRGDPALAIRKHVSSDLSLREYEAQGAFKISSQCDLAADDPVARMVAEGAHAAALSLAVQLRRNILVSGGTSSGKTSFLNALIREIPAKERLIFIEDTPELRMRHANAIGLLAARSGLREAASVTADELVAASLRMRPDRIILGELRGSEAGAFLRAINTGHPGSVATIHADSPSGAVEQLTMLVLQSGLRLNRDHIRDYVRRTIGVFVHLQRTDRGRAITNIAFPTTIII